MRIGIIDSGVGGLNVLPPLITTLGGEYIYIADNAYAPYGTLSAEQLNGRIGSLCNRLCDKNVDCIVLGCNTASLTFLPDEVGGKKIFKLKQDFSSAGESSLVLSTLLSSEKLFDYLPTGAISLGLQNLATDIENSLPDVGVMRDELTLRLRRYCPSSVYLACTHYVYLRNIVEEIFPRTPVYDGIDGLVQEVREYYFYPPPAPLTPVKIHFTGDKEVTKYKKIVNNSFSVKFPLVFCDDL